MFIDTRPWLRFIEGEDGGSGSDGTNTSAGSGDDTNSNSEQSGSDNRSGDRGDGDNKDGSDEGEGGRTFTQAELDSIIGKRLAKFSDYDALKTELDQLKTAASEVPNVEQALAAQKAELEADHAAALLAATSRGIAAELGFHAPAEAALYLDAKTLTEGNAIDEKKVEEALKQALADRPYLAKSAGFNTGLGRRGGDPAVKPGVDRLAAAFNTSLAD